MYTYDGSLSPLLPDAPRLEFNGELLDYAQAEEKLTSVLSFLYV